MAASLVASAVQWIGSMLIQEGSILFEVADKVRGLQEELELMQQYLQDADAKQEAKEIRPLIKQIRKLVFDAEDVIDTYILEVEAKANKGWFKKAACFLHTAPQSYSIGKQIQLMENNVKRITERLVDNGVRKILKVGDVLRLPSYQERVPRNKPQSYPYDDDGEYIVGLENDVKKLVEVLMEEGKTQVKIVSIVGMGGSGKTTLARKLFNHRYTKECFDCCAWVYISQEWSTRHVLSEILRKVSSPLEMSNFNRNLCVEELVDTLRNILEKKSYLVVLDDVWSKEALEEILPALPRLNNNKGSKIVITTRNQEVVRFPNLQRHLYVHQPRPLNKEESWELFCKIAFIYHTNSNNKSYEALGKEMLNKCDGLPLAIVALAGILNTKRSIEEWQLVSEAVHSRVMEGSCTHMYGRVGDMLALSYDDLPCHLKPCFLYLGVFPEDCQIPTGTLIRMWIAEGLVSANENMSLEDVAMQCVETLSHRFMIQVVRTNFRGAIKVIHMHDLIRDICVRKAREQWFLQINTPTNNFLVSDAWTTDHSRRVSLHSSTCFPTQVSKVRSLVILTKSSIAHSAYDSKETLDLGILHQNFKLLRLLNLWGIKTPTETLPTQIGSLIHLRYLGIRATNITELPKSIGNLKNLLTLDYRNVESFNNIKNFNSLGKLALLRHLFLPIECSWKLEELQLSALKNLQVLWGVKCEGGEWFARELAQLSTTLKKLKAVVSTENNLEAVFCSPSLMSDHLSTFHCEWKVGIALKGVKSNLSHNQNLHKLVLVGKIQVEKLCHLLPSNLLVLELKNSVMDEDPMIAVGALTHLKLLRLSNSYVGSQFTCNLGSFPQLEELYLENFENVATWKIEMGAMVNLKKLYISSCRKIQFPQGLVFVTTLQQLDFSEIPEVFVQTANAYGWFQKTLKLPHNIEAIIEQCDSVVDMSSIHKLYEQLTTGVYLNKRKKKFWVVKQDDQQYNCFMVYATNLSLSTKVDVDGLPEWIKLKGDDIKGNTKMEDDIPNGTALRRTKMYDWEWKQAKKRDGAVIEVVRLKAPVRVACVGGKFNTNYLSPHVTYTFTCMIMLDRSAMINEMSVISSLFFLPNASSLHLPLNVRIQENKHKVNDKPRHEWIGIPLGEYEPHTRTNGVAEFSLHFQWPEITEVGLSVKGVIIEPKLP